MSRRRGFLPKSAADRDPRASTTIRPSDIGASFTRELSPLRKQWREFSADKPFSDFEPVTMGKVCFLVPQAGSLGPPVEWPDPKAGEKVPIGN